MQSSSNHILPLSARYMLLSALGFALMAACVKEVSTYGIPVMEIIAARAVVSLIISYLDVKRKGISLWGTDKPLLIARGVVGALALICVYYAITTLPLAEATLIQYLHPAFTAIIALIFLREQLHLSTIICIVLSIAGLAIIVQPGQWVGELSELPRFSVIIAIVGALGSAVAYVLVRKLSQREDSSVIIFYFPLVALPVACLFPGESFVMPDLPALILLILVGIFTQIGQVGLTNAMQIEGAGKATAYSYVQVIFALILGWVIFAEIPSFWTWLGGSFIIVGALINTLGYRPGKKPEG
ncbi:MAG: DMT family transporter [Gammaproteobacteria bacterium]|nr:DMT family transporter [Gammaproteobacteria bacterium]